MNKKELQELKRQLKWDNEKLLLKGIQEAYGKSSDGEPVLSCSRLIDSFDLEKEEGDLYFEIFKKSLSGTFGKNLLEYGFETTDPKSREIQNHLYALKNGDLLKDDVFEELARDLLRCGDYRNSVHIIGGLFEYSAPGLNSAHEQLEDGSIFRFMIVAISQAKLTDIGLFYSVKDNEVRRKINEEMEILPSPLDAFVYPAFTGRASDVSHLLYHCRSAKSPNIGLIEEYFHIPFTSTAQEQSEGFAQVISEVFPNGLQAKAALKFHENLSDLVREYSEEQAVVTLRKEEVKDLLNASGAQKAEMEHFDSAFSRILEDQEVCAVNLLEKGKISVKAPSISVSVKDDALEKIQTRTIDGKPCLVIALDEGVEVSGLPVTLTEAKKDVIVHPAARKETEDEEFDCADFV